jgi:hypothetical protein
LICLLLGYVVVVLCALSLLHVPVEYLLLGGVLAGVILGIAAQQVLANLFAGVMLLFSQAVRDRRRADDPFRCPRRPNHRPSHRDDPRLRQDPDEGGAGAAAQQRSARRGRRTGYRLAWRVASVEVVARV